MSVSQIAQISGVSKATVSRVLNGRPGVQPNNVKAVLEAARQLQYELPGKATGRVKKAERSMLTIAYLRTDKEVVANHTSTELLVYEGMAAAAADRHIDLICGTAHDVEHLPEAVGRGRLDGVVMAGMSPSPDVLERLKGYPQVWVTSFRTTDDVYVLPGNEQVGAMALEYLRQRGHHHVAVINPFSRHPAMASRSMFFEFSARQRGMSVVSHASDQSFASGGVPEYWNHLEQTFDVLLSRIADASPRPTGVFVPGSLGIAMAYRAAHRRGLIPGVDLDFVTCGGEVEVMALHPRPGVIDISPQEMGRRAIDILLAKIESPHVRHGTIAVDPHLVAGEAFGGD